MEIWILLAEINAISVDFLGHARTRPSNKLVKSLQKKAEDSLTLMTGNAKGTILNENVHISSTKNKNMFKFAAVET